VRNRSPIGPSPWKKLVLRAAVLAGLGTPMVVGLLNAPAIRAQDAIDWQTRAGGKMAFDVASIKPSKGAFVTSNFPLDPSEDYGAMNGRLTADGTLAEYVEFAYKVPLISKAADIHNIALRIQRALCRQITRDKSSAAFVFAGFINANRNLNHAEGHR
jgi:hypothetical protein